MRLTLIVKSVITLIVLCGTITMFASSFPTGTKILEAENYFVKGPSFILTNSIHVSAGIYIKKKEKAFLDKPVLLIQTNFPKTNKKYTIWVRSRGLILGLSSSLLKIKTFNTVSPYWKWHKLGRYSAKEIGSSFSITAIPNKNNQLTTTGIDSIMLVPVADFKPTGIYNSALGPKEKNKAQRNNSNTLQTTVTIRTDKTGSKISSFIASANAHGAKRHVLDNASWDNTMRYFFSGNLLVVLQNSLKKPNKNGEWWDFKQLDRFILAAKSKWKVKDVMILPQWRLKWKNKNDDPTEHELQQGRNLIMQLVKRYGQPGPLSVKYWVLSDEWASGGYWKNKYLKFVEFYTSTVKITKEFNPKLKVGGPVNCWPDNKIIAALLQKCPELDFISWNMFITGRADMPLPALFKRTAFLKSEIKSSRELSRKILGRELPVIVSSYGQNYHAWSPPDYKLAQPIGGVWNALALNYMVEAKCFSGVFYNIKAKDCGLFGPGDSFARKSNMISPSMGPDEINIRPVARIHYFFKKNIAGTSLNELSISGDNDKFSIISTVDKKGYQNIVAVNFAENYRQVTIKLSSFIMPNYSDFNFPSEYLYCDKYNIRSGKGLFFSNKGESILYMPPFSSYCIRTKVAENLNKDTAALFYMDGRYYDQCRSGSHSLGWYGDHFTKKIFKTETGAVDCVGKNKRGRIRLVGNAAISGKKAFGIAFWVYRVKNINDYGSIISFGTNKLEIEHVGGGNSDNRFQLKNAGFCKFDGKWQHNIQIPRKKWTHIAITADNKTGRIIIDGKQKFSFKQTGRGLNGSNIFYLGSQKNNTGVIDCYIDELVISAKPCGGKWAEKIFNATRKGKRYRQ